MLKSLCLGVACVGAAVAQSSQSLNATLSNNTDVSALASLIGQFPALASALSSATNITILAPSNDALNTLLNSSAGKTLASNPGLTQAILQYHVLNGTYAASAIPENVTFVPSLLTNTSYTNVTGGQVVGAVRSGDNVTFLSGLGANVSVSTPNVNFTGGVIHIIDGVLTLPSNVSDTAIQSNLTSLAGALGLVNLTDTVDTLSDVTIFAPSNAAFQSIASAFSNASNETIASVLEYHVVNGTVGYSSTLVNDTQLTTVNGANLTVYVENGTVFVNGAAVIKPDVLVANGVVHVIDNVLNPNNTSAAPSASATAGSPNFSGASSVSEPPFTSGVASPTTTAGAGSGGSGSSSSSSSTGGSAPMRTGAVGAAALFGAGAAFMNL